MKRYQVSWTESKICTIQVEAKNEEDAQVKAFKKYDHEWDAKPKIEEDSSSTPNVDVALRLTIEGFGLVDLQKVQM